MENINERMYYLNFRNLCGENIMIKKKGEEKVGDVIKSYLEIIKKSNLFINTNIDNLYFTYNGEIIKQYEYEKKN